MNIDESEEVAMIKHHYSLKVHSDDEEEKSIQISQIREEERVTMMDDQRQTPVH